MTASARPKESTDEEFLLQLYASPRAQELSLMPWSAEEKDVFVRMQYGAQTYHYAHVYPELNDQIILCEGISAGRLLTARLHDEIRIVDSSLLPEYHNKGISTSLLTEVLKEAGQEGKRVRLYGSAGNPAKQLYERLGFREIQNDGVHIRMEATPAASQV
jgi:ribosomal protein S18 acetylase RimI-like enzyme